MRLRVTETAAPLVIRVQLSVVTLGSFAAVACAALSGICQLHHWNDKHSGTSQRGKGEAERSRLPFDIQCRSAPGTLRHPFPKSAAFRSPSLLDTVQGRQLQRQAVPVD